MLSTTVYLPPRSLVVSSIRSGCGRPGFDPRPRHTKDVKNGRFALLSLALGIHELGIDPTGQLGVSINGLSNSFLLTCGGIESVAWHMWNPKIVGRRSFGPNKTGPP